MWAEVVSDYRPCSERFSQFSSFLFASRLFTVPYFFVRSFRYTASYRHGFVDFQMYRGGGRRGLLLRSDRRERAAT